MIGKISPGRVDHQAELSVTDSFDVFPVTKQILKYTSHPFSSSVVYRRIVLFWNINMLKLEIDWNVNSIHKYR